MQMHYAAGMCPVEPKKKSEVGSKMVGKIFLFQIWVLCNPKIGTLELHKNLFLLILNFGSSKSGKKIGSRTHPCYAVCTMHIYIDY
jgi:hypothetical protein